MAAYTHFLCLLVPSVCTSKWQHRYHVHVLSFQPVKEILEKNVSFEIRLKLQF